MNNPDVIKSPATPNTGSLERAGWTSAVEKPEVFKCKCGWTGTRQQLHQRPSGIGVCHGCYRDGQCLRIPRLMSNDRTERPEAKHE